MAILTRSGTLHPGESGCKPLILRCRRDLSRFSSQLEAFQLAGWTVQPDGWRVQPRVWTTPLVPAEGPQRLQDRPTCRRATKAAVRSGGGERCCRRSKAIKSGKSAPPAGVGSQRVLRPLPSTSPSSVRRPAVIWKSGTIHAASRRRAPSTSRRLRRARTTASCGSRATVAPALLCPRKPTARTASGSGSRCRRILRVTAGQCCNLLLGSAVPVARRRIP